MSTKGTKNRRTFSRPDLKGRKRPDMKGKWGRPAGFGRKKGTPNKVNQTLREFFDMFTAQNKDLLQPAFRDLLAENPGEALRIFANFSEFVTPKLQRTEVTDSEGRSLPPPVFAVSFPVGGPGLPQLETSNNTFDVEAAEDLDAVLADTTVPG